MQGGLQMEIQKKLEIVSYQHDVDTQKYLATIRFPNLLNKSEKTTLHIDRSLLFQPKELQTQILNAGGPVLSNIESDLKNIQDDTCVPINHIVHKSGWHDDDFVTPYGDFSAPTLTTSTHYSLNKQDFFYKGLIQKGDLKSFIKGLQKPLKYCEALRLALMASLAPVVADRLGYKNHALLTLTGPASREKSLILRAAMAVYTKATAQDMPSLFASHWYNQKRNNYFNGLCLPFDCKIRDIHDSNKCKKISNSLIKFLTPSDNQFNYFILILGIDSTENITLEHKTLRKNSLCHINLYIQSQDELLGFNNKPKNVEIFDKLEETISNNFGHLLSTFVDIIRSESKENLNMISEVAKIAFSARIKRELRSIPINIDDLNSYSELFTSMYISSFYYNNSIDKKFDFKKQTKEIFKLVIKNINKTHSTAAFSCDELHKMLHEQANKLPKCKIGEIADKNSYPDGFLRNENGIIYANFTQSGIQKIIEKQHSQKRITLSYLWKCGLLIKPKTGYTTHLEQAGLGRHRYYKFDYNKICKRAEINLKN